MLASDLTQANLDSFSELERIGAALSLLGTVFIILTFLSSEDFQKPVNRLIFYACLGNIMMSVASLIARDALKEVIKQGHDNYYNFFCQFQGFLVQMFLPADALWTFVMALNVYLTFFWKFDAIGLRALEKWYCVSCYGIPFIPALIYLVISTPARGHPYGDATLWCWISDNWNDYRIATFYGPVWLVICATVFIYIYAGKEIYNKTKLLRDFHKAALSDPNAMPRSPRLDGVYVSTTVTTTSAPIDLDRLTPTGRQSMSGPASHSPSTHGVEVKISVGDPKEFESLRLEVPTRQNSSSFESNGKYTEKPFDSRPLPALPTSPISPYTPTFGRRPSLNPSSSMVATSAMLAYTRVAMLFFVAMMLTWIPSSANRVYSVIYPKDVSLFLESFSAFVLTLQGFWNAVIYAATSIEACKNLIYQLKTTKRINCNGIRNIIRGFPTDDELRASNQVAPNKRRSGISQAKDNDNESQTGLNRKETRPQTGKNRYGDAETADAINFANSRDDSRVTSRVTSLEDREYSFEEFALKTSPSSVKRPARIHKRDDDPGRPTRIRPTEHTDAYARALVSRETGHRFRDSTLSEPEDYSHESAV